MSQGPPLRALVHQIPVRIHTPISHRQHEIVAGQAVIVGIGIEKDFGHSRRARYISEGARSIGIGGVEGGNKHLVSGKTSDSDCLSRACAARDFYVVAGPYTSRRIRVANQNEIAPRSADGVIGRWRIDELVVVRQNGIFERQFARVLIPGSEEVVFYVLEGACVDARDID